MATSQYFNNYSNQYNEQRLVEDLIVEAIKMVGTNCYYLPNTNAAARDLIYGEDPLKAFTAAFPIELYPSNVMEYNGSSEIFSKFGLEIKSGMTLIMSKRSFAEKVVNGVTTYEGKNLSRPMEGDLIFVPALNGAGELFEIRFVEQNKDMTMFGRRFPFFYELDVEKFKYSNETIATGVELIDDVQRFDAYTKLLTVTSANGVYVVGETVYQSADGTTANAYSSGVVVAYDFPSGSLYLNTIKGEFVANSYIKGLSSNAISTLYGTDTYEQAQHEATYDNKDINSESIGIIDNSETNPLGKI
jgi:hypothetical protein